MAVKNIIKILLKKNMGFKFEIIKEITQPPDYALSKYICSEFQKYQLCDLIVTVLTRKRWIRKSTLDSSYDFKWSNEHELHRIRKSEQTHFT